jgi:hypothetical protein
MQRVQQWVVYLETGTAEVYRPGKDVRPGFRLPLKDVFAALQPE